MNSIALLFLLAWIPPPPDVSPLELDRVRAGVVYDCNDGLSDHDRQHFNAAAVVENWVEVKGSPRWFCVYMPRWYIDDARRTDW